MWTVTSDMLVGRYEMEVPYLGPIFTAVRSPMGLVTVLAVVILVVGLPEIKKYGGFSDV